MPLHNDLPQILLESATEVLETMFFTGILDENAEETAPELVSAELLFRGSPSGRFGVRVPVATGRLIASSFLGLDESELSQSHVEEVVGELTNMICGSALSRIEAGARFELLHPQIIPSTTDWRQYPDVAGSTFELEEGTLTLWVTLEEKQLTPACSAA